MRTLLLTGVALGVLFCVPRDARCDAARRTGDGLSTKEFVTFANSLSELPGRIQAVRLFTESDGERSSVAIATWGQRSGWQIFVFDSAKGRNYRLEWKSGRLDDTFSVSWAGALRTFAFGASEGISFEGCAPHSCPNSVFSVLLYVPSKRTAFTAKYVLGKVTYSPRLKYPANRRYKGALRQLVRERVNRWRFR